MIFTAGKALAAPKGIDPADVGKLLYNFNVIAVPNEWVADDSTCPNSGHRMFFRRVASALWGQFFGRLTRRSHKALRLPTVMELLITKQICRSTAPADSTSSPGSWDPYIHHWILRALTTFSLTKLFV